jgi:hypothetical protein
VIDEQIPGLRDFIHTHFHRTLAKHDDVLKRDVILRIIEKRSGLIGEPTE